MSRQPDLEIKIYFVEYGYQIDFFENDIQIASECGDYGEEYSIPTLKAWATRSIAAAMRREPKK